MSNLIILDTVVTEKSHKMQESSVYSFFVSKLSNKILIKKEIERIFSVKVSSVKVLNVDGKKTKFKGISGSVASYKKAYIHLVPGMKIDVEKLSISKDV